MARLCLWFQILNTTRELLRVNLWEWPRFAYVALHLYIVLFDGTVIVFVLEHTRKLWSCCRYCCSCRAIKPFKFSKHTRTEKPRIVLHSRLTLNPPSICLACVGARMCGAFACRLHKYIQTRIVAQSAHRIGAPHGHHTRKLWLLLTTASLCTEMRARAVAAENTADASAQSHTAPDPPAQPAKPASHDNRINTHTQTHTSWTTNVYYTHL